MNGAPTQPLLQQLRQIDRQRPDFPGEHTLVTALGLALWWGASRCTSGWGRTLALAAGTALLCRAASGRNGLARWLR